MPNEELKLLIEKATKIEKIVEEQKTTQEDLKKIHENLRNVEQEILSLKQDRVPGVHDESHGKEFSVALSENPAYQAFIQNPQNAISIELEHIDTPEGFLAPDRTIGLVTEKSLDSGVISAFNVFPTTSDVVTYVREKEYTNNAAGIDRGQKYPESSVEMRLRKANVIKIGHSLTVTEELVQDAPSFLAYLKIRLTDGLKEEVEDQILNGNDSVTQLGGLFHTGNYTEHGLTKESFPYPPNQLDVLRRCSSMMKAKKYTPKYIFMNPMDLDNLVGMKDKMGQSYFKDPLIDFDQTKPWGIQFISSAFVKENHFMVANARKGASLFVRKGIVIEMAKTHAENFTSGLVTIKVYKRMTMTVEKPKCFIGGTFPDLSDSPAA